MYKMLTIIHNNIRFKNIFVVVQVCILKEAIILYHFKNILLFLLDIVPYIVVKKLFVNKGLFNIYIYIFTRFVASLCLLRYPFIPSFCAQPNCWLFNNTQRIPEHLFTSINYWLISKFEGFCIITYISYFVWFRTISKTYASYILYHHYHCLKHHGDFQRLLNF